MEQQIFRNKAQCKNCGDVIESRDRWDFVWCKCGSIAVDGGTDYLKRIGDFANIIELSEYVDSKIQVKRTSPNRRKLLPDRKA